MHKQNVHAKDYKKKLQFALNASLALLFSLLFLSLGIYTWL